MNWTECEKEVRALLIKAANGTGVDSNTEGFNVFMNVAESELASFIYEHFGLEPDKKVA